MTSFAFMLVLVPEPVWNTSIGKLRVVLARGHFGGRGIDGRRHVRARADRAACWRARPPA